MFIPQPSKCPLVFYFLPFVLSLPLGPDRGRSLCSHNHSHYTDPCILQTCSCLDHSFARTLAKWASPHSPAWWVYRSCPRPDWECFLNAVLLPYNSYGADMKLLGIISPGSLHCVGCHGNNSSSSNLLYFSNLWLFHPNVRSAFRRVKPSSGRSHARPAWPPSCSWLMSGLRKVKRTPGAERYFDPDREEFCPRCLHIEAMLCQLQYSWCHCCHSNPCHCLGPSTGISAALFTCLISQWHTFSTSLSSRRPFESNAACGLFWLLRAPSTPSAPPPQPQQPFGLIASIQSAIAEHKLMFSTCAEFPLLSQVSVFSLKHFVSTVFSLSK